MSIKETAYTILDKLGLTATLLAIPTNILGALTINEIFTYCISLLSAIWLVLKIQNELLSKRKLKRELNKRTIN